MNWHSIWLHLFGTAELFGIDMGFWVSMGISALIAIMMNIVFWAMKPAEPKK